jgi:hypothetical protein
MEQRKRFILWVSVPPGADPIAVCWGTQSDMSELARDAGLASDVYVLPEGQKPAKYHS